MRKIVGSHSTAVTVVTCILSLFSVVGCVGNQIRKPVFIIDDPEIIKNIEVITMLPIVTLADMSDDRKLKLSIQAHKKLALELALKGYALQRADKFSANKELFPRDIITMSTEELALLGPKDSKYIIITFIEEVQDSSIVIMDSSDVRVSAVLIDKRKRRLLWKNNGFSHASTSIAQPLGLVLIMFDEAEVAIFSSITNLFKNFPEKH